MPFSLGGFELIVLFAVALPVVVLYFLDDRRYRTGIPVLVCTALAAIITPADLLSMLVLLIVFLAIFLFGSRYHPIG